MRLIKIGIVGAKRERNGTSERNGADMQTERNERSGTERAKRNGTSGTENVERAKRQGYGERSEGTRSTGTGERDNV